MYDLLANRLSELRKQKGMTQDQVANQLGVSYQAVSKWETGVSCPDISTLPLLADLFGVSIDSLFGREAVQPAQETAEVPDEETEETEVRSLYELPWPDDETLHIVIFAGQQLIAQRVEEPRILSLKRQLEFQYEGPAMNIQSDLDLSVSGPVNGNIAANGDVTCEGVNGCVSAGGDVRCDAVMGNVTAGGDVSCDNVTGNVQSGGDVSCDDVQYGNVTAGGDVNCGEINCSGGYIKAEGDVSCDGVQGDVSAGGNVSCDDIGGNVQAGGDINCGDVNGNANAGGDLSCGDVRGSAFAGGDLNVN